MSVHIAAKAGEITFVILLPGDLPRAKFISGNFLENAGKYNEVRDMHSFTGIYKGKRVSVRGTGMGIPSSSMYMNELFKNYKVKQVIRIGTAVSIQANLKVRNPIIVMSAGTDSGTNTLRFGWRDFTPAASFSPVKKHGKPRLPGAGRLWSARYSLSIVYTQYPFDKYFIIY